VCLTIAFGLEGCAYRWFSTPEICMILERYDALAFAGDDIARKIYGAFNVLLREDLEFGALREWEMDEAVMNLCSCESMFAVDETGHGPVGLCASYVVRGSSQLSDARDGESNYYYKSESYSDFLPYDLCSS
jgi:hypothetical protein